MKSVHSRFLISGGQVVLPTGVRRGAVLVENGKFAGVLDVPESKPRGATVVDASGCFVLPGLIELHVQGAGGSDLIDDDPGAVERIAKSLASFGTTAFLATTVIDTTRKDQPHIERIVQCARRKRVGARLLGIHLEGPFINPVKKGMIQEKFICAPSRDYFAWIKTICKGTLRMMTVAPELPGALDIIRELTDCAVPAWLDGEERERSTKQRPAVVGTLGHTNATYEEAMAGIEAGLSHATHMGNAMRSFHHRDPGAFWAALTRDSVSLQIITDGVHLHPGVFDGMVRLMGRKRFERLAIITDGMGAMGMPPGRYDYGGLEYDIENGTARYIDGTLIGTALTQLQLVQRAMRFAGLKLHEAVNMASLHPARVLGVDRHKGSIALGNDADLIICDRDLNVKTVFVEGEPVPRDEDT